MDKLDKLGILVLSCDKYSDLWSPFLLQFQRFFPINDYKIYLGSNTKVFNHPNIKTLLSGDDKDWSSSLIKILNQIREQKILIILEDIFICSKLDTDSFNLALEYLFKKNALHIKYLDNYCSLDINDNNKIHIYPKFAPYRATVCGFWDREYLRSILIDGENPWNFEIMGSYRAAYVDGIYTLVNPLFKYHNMIEKGFWLPKSVNWAISERINLKLDNRPILIGRSKFINLLKKKYFELIYRIPWKIRVAILNKLRLLLISY